jgi:PIN domain-containing protein
VSVGIDLAVQVAVTRRLRLSSLAGRPLESIVEPADQIHLGSELFAPALISTVERALFECAQKPPRAGGIANVAEALAAAQPDPGNLQTLATQLAMIVGLRRLLSLDHTLDMGKLSAIHLSRQPTRLLTLDPTDAPRDGPTDVGVAVRWPCDPDELREVVNRPSASWRRRHPTVRGLFERLPISVIPLDLETAIVAARLHATHRALRLPDALVIATAIEDAADQLVTTDRKWPTARTLKLKASLRHL